MQRLAGKVAVNLNFTAGADAMAMAVDRCGIRTIVSSRAFLCHASPGNAVAFIGAILLWDILFRGQLGFSVSFLEEMWSRNLANLMISPLRPIEFVLALTIQSVIRLSIGMVPVPMRLVRPMAANIVSGPFTASCVASNSWWKK